MSDVDKFLESLGMKGKIDPNAETWDKIIQPKASYLIIGDIDTGKSGLAYWLLERYSQKYNLTPASVGFPTEKSHLLSSDFIIPTAPSECIKLENSVAFIDEADIQLPIDEPKSRRYVTNFLSLPQHRNQIFILGFHFPRLALSRYLPFFSAFLIKRPPYLLEFAGKRQGDVLTQMMKKAEERFAELPSHTEVVKHTYVVAPKARWQGMLQNPLPSFWTEDLRHAWSGVGIGDEGQFSFKTESSELTTEERLQHYGVPPELWAKVIEMDRDHSLEELQEMCRKKGLATTGDKKKLASALLMEETDEQK